MAAHSNRLNALAGKLKRRPPLRKRNPRNLPVQARPKSSSSSFGKQSLRTRASAARSLNVLSKTKSLGGTTVRKPLPRRRSGLSTASLRSRGSAGGTRRTSLGSLKGRRGLGATRANSMASKLSRPRRRLPTSGIRRAL